MDKKIMTYIKQSILLVFLLYLPHFIKNWIVSVYKLESIINMPAHMRVFNKFVALEVFIFLLVIFFLFFRKTLETLKPSTIMPGRLILFTLLSYLSIGFYYFISIVVNRSHIYYGIPALSLVIGQFLLLFLYLMFLIIGVFGKKFIKDIHTKTKPTIWYFVAAQIVLTIALILFEKMWRFFSEAVTIALFLMLRPFYDIFVSFGESGGPVLAVGDFAVSIGSPCSGIDSMLLFIAFFTAIFALDYHKLRKGRYAIFFIIGFIGVIAVNILRLFALMLVGIHISPEIAVGFFHTNAGWVLFILYFLAYYWLIKRWIYKTPGIQKKPKK